MRDSETGLDWRAAIVLCLAIGLATIGAGVLADLLLSVMDPPGPPL